MKFHIPNVKKKHCAGSCLDPGDRPNLGRPVDNHPSSEKKEDLISALQDDVQDIQRESDRLDALKEQSKSIKDN